MAPKPASTQNDGGFTAKPANFGQSFKDEAKTFVNKNLFANPMIRPIQNTNTEENESKKCRVKPKVDVEDAENPDIERQIKL